MSEANAKDARSRCDLLAEVMRSRSAFYRLLSRLFLKPLEDDDIKMLTDMDFVSQASEMGDGSMLAQGLNDMGRGLRRQHSGTRMLLSTDYTMCFDGVPTKDGKVAAPYASVFLSEDGLLCREPRNDVYRLFAQSGLRLKKGVDLPEDHISFEFEYLAILADRAAEAAEHGRASEAERMVDDSINFLENHLVTWLPMLADIAGSLLKTRFYQGVMKAAVGYVELDRQTLSDAKGLCREAA